MFPFNGAFSRMGGTKPRKGMGMGIARLVAASGKAIFCNTSDRGFIDLKEANEHLGADARKMAAFQVALKQRKKKP